MSSVFLLPALPFLDVLDVEWSLFRNQKSTKAEVKGE